MNCWRPQVIFRFFYPDMWGLLGMTHRRPYRVDMNLLWSKLKMYYSLFVSVENFNCFVFNCRMAKLTEISSVGYKFALQF